MAKQGHGWRASIEREDKQVSTDNDHGITGELREWARDNTVQDKVLTTYPAQHPVHGTVESLLRIADRIDAEHEKAEDEWKAKDGQTWLRGYGECHAELMEGNKVIAADLERAGWVKLPKDADGEVIHLGDVVMLPDWPFCHHEVINLVYAHDGWAIISRHGSIEASEHTVHVKPKKPTVEDVLDEFASAYDRIGGEDEEHQKYLNLITEYAAKLQLRGDAE